jgi:hypothetical protein
MLTLFCPNWEAERSGLYPLKNTRSLIPVRAIRQHLSPGGVRGHPASHDTACRIACSSEGGMPEREASAR